MSYEPNLIIRRKDLEKALPSLIERRWSTDEDTQHIAKYLMYVLDKHMVIKFDDLELVLCKPELTSFNKLVRDCLYELDVDYREEY